MRNFKRFRLGDVYRSKAYPDDAFIIDFIDEDVGAMNKATYAENTHIGVYMLNKDYSIDIKATELYKAIDKKKFKKCIEKRTTIIEVYKNDYKNYCAALYLIDGKGRKL